MNPRQLKNLLSETVFLFPICFLFFYDNSNCHFKLFSCPRLPYFFWWLKHFMSGHTSQHRTKNKKLKCSLILVKYSYETKNVSSPEKKQGSRDCELRPSLRLHHFTIIFSMHLFKQCSCPVCLTSSDDRYFTSGLSNNHRTKN